METINSILCWLIIIAVTIGALAFAILAPVYFIAAMVFLIFIKQLDN